MDKNNKTTNNEGLNELLQLQNQQLRENIIKIQGVCKSLDNRVQTLTEALRLAKEELSKRVLLENEGLPKENETNKKGGEIMFFDSSRQMYIGKHDIKKEWDKEDGEFVARLLHIELPHLLDILMLHLDFLSSSDKEREFWRDMVLGICSNRINHQRYDCQKSFERVYENNDV